MANINHRQALGDIDTNIQLETSLQPHKAAATTQPSDTDLASQHTGQFNIWIQALGDKASSNEVLDGTFAAIKLFASSKSSNVCMQLREKLFKCLEESLQTQGQGATCAGAACALMKLMEGDRDGAEVSEQMLSALLAAVRGKDAGMEAALWAVTRVLQARLVPHPIPRLVRCVQKAQARELPRYLQCLHTALGSYHVSALQAAHLDAAFCALGPLHAYDSVDSSLRGEVRGLASECMALVEAAEAELQRARAPPPVCSTPAPGDGDVEMMSCTPTPSKIPPYQAVPDALNQGSAQDMMDISPAPQSALSSEVAALEGLAAGGSPVLDAGQFEAEGEAFLHRLSLGAGATPRRAELQALVDEAATEAERYSPTAELPAQLSQLHAHDCEPALQTAEAPEVYGEDQENLTGCKDSAVVKAEMDAESLSESLFVQQNLCVDVLGQVFRQGSDVNVQEGACDVLAPKEPELPLEHSNAGFVEDCELLDSRTRGAYDAACDPALGMVSVTCDEDDVCDRDERVDFGCSEEEQAKAQGQPTWAESDLATKKTLPPGDTLQLALTHEQAGAKDPAMAPMESLREGDELGGVAHCATGASVVCIGCGDLDAATTPGCAAILVAKTICMEAPTSAESAMQETLENSGETLTFGGLNESAGPATFCSLQKSKCLADCEGTPHVEVVEEAPLDPKETLVADEAHALERERAQPHEDDVVADDVSCQVGMCSVVGELVVPVQEDLTVPTACGESGCGGPVVATVLEEVAVPEVAVNRKRCAGDEYPALLTQAKPTATKESSSIEDLVMDCGEGMALVRDELAGQGLPLDNELCAQEEPPSVNGGSSCVQVSEQESSADLEMSIHGFGVFEELSQKKFAGHEDSTKPEPLVNGGLVSSPEEEVAEQQVPMRHLEFDMDVASVDLFCTEDVPERMPACHNESPIGEEVLVLPVSEPMDQDALVEHDECLVDGEIALPAVSEPMDQEVVVEQGERPVDGETALPAVSMKMEQEVVIVHDECPVDGKTALPAVSEPMEQGPSTEDGESVVDGHTVVPPVSGALGQDSWTCHEDSPIGGELVMPASPHFEAKETFAEHEESASEMKELIVPSAAELEPASQVCGSGTKQADGTLAHEGSYIAEELAKLRAQLCQSERARARAAAVAAGAVERACALERAVTELQAQAAVADNESKQMEAIVREHEDTIQQLRDEDSRRVVASQGQVALVEARLAATRTEYQTLSDKFKTLLERYSEYKSKYSISVANEKKWADKMADVQHREQAMADITMRADTHLREVQAERDSLLAELARVKQDLGSETEKHSILVSAHEDLKGVLKEVQESLKCSQHEVNTKSEKIQELQLSERRYKQQYEDEKIENEKAHIVMVQYSTKMSQLQSDLETKTDENDQIKQMCADLIAHQEMTQSS